MQALQLISTVDGELDVLRWFENAGVGGAHQLPFFENLPPLPSFPIGTAFFSQKSDVGVQGDPGDQNLTVIQKCTTGEPLVAFGSQHRCGDHFGRVRRGSGRGGLYGKRATGHQSHRGD